MRTFFKSVGRSFRKNISRFISIVFIVLISVSLTSGVGATGKKLNDSISEFAVERNVSDVIIKSKTQSGFSEDQILALKNEYGAENVNAGASFDVYISVNGERRLTRLYFSDDPLSATVNKFSAESAAEGAEGSAVSSPDDEKIVYSEIADDFIKGYSAGDKITLDFGDILLQLAEQGDRELSDYEKQFFALLDPVTVTVAGALENPLLFSKGGEPSYLNETDEIPDVMIDDGFIFLDDALYLPFSVIPVATAISDIYISLPKRSGIKLFSGEYKELVARGEAKITEILAYVSGADEETIKEQTAFLTLGDNFSFKSINAYASKITGLAVALAVAFTFITALVVLSNMTRLMEEERAQTACLITLGYSPKQVIGKYLLFVFVATSVGGVAAYFVGTGLCSFIYLVFGYSYVMPPESGIFSATAFLISFAFIVVTALFATLRSGLKTSAETPAELLKPRSPVPGKKVIIEKIPFIWNRLSFKYKSTARNVLRYMNRFIMTVVAVAGSMGLVIAGLALLDMCLFGNFGNASIAWLAVVVVAFAALLTLTAIYTITNISISERNREIATLMVLGYYDGEVSGYIYREIYIDVVVGVVFGYGVGAVLANIVFAVMGVGSLAKIGWYVWLIAPAVVWFFTFLVTIILRKRIISVDMNASLKAAE